jgi:uncharacterized protein involved in outer membrane biogenesis
MTTPIKILLILAAGAAALLVAAALAVSLLVRPEDYRPLLVEGITNATGRTFELEGELGLDLFPCCALSLGPARLGNPEGFPDDSFARVRTASVSIELWPLLLRREVRLGTTRIEGLELHLLRLEDGRGNWSFTPIPSEEPAGSAPEPADTRGLADLRMAGIELTGGQLDYRNLESGRTYAATDLRLTTGSIGYGETLEIEAPDLALTLAGERFADGRLDVAFRGDHVSFVPSTGAVDIAALDLRLGDSRVTGSIAGAEGARGAPAYDLTVDRFDLDDFLPAPIGEPDTSKPADSAPMELPVEPLRRLDFTGRLRVGEFRARGWELAEVDARVLAKDGVLQFEPLTARLYDGTFAGTVTVDATGPAVRVMFDQQIDGLQVGALLQRRYGRETLAGTLSVSLRGSGAGRNSAELVRALTGPVEINLVDGVYRGTDVLYEISRASALLEQQPAPPKPANPETPIDRLVTTGRLAGGVLHSDAVNLTTPALQVTGAGKLDLLRLEIDYDLKAELLAAGSAAAGERLSDLLGKRIPFTLKGPAASPKVRVDLEDVLKRRAKDALKGRARDLLRGLLGSPDADD